jgi:hypothetical protein
LGDLRCLNEHHEGPFAKQMVVVDLTPLRGYSGASRATANWMLGVSEWMAAWPSIGRIDLEMRNNKLSFSMHLLGYTAYALNTPPEIPVSGYRLPLCYCPIRSG